jgi:hypothetical protein
LPDKCSGAVSPARRMPRLRVVVRKSVLDQIRGGRAICAIKLTQTAWTYPRWKRVKTRAGARF